MANKDQITILTQSGTDAFNAWRAENPHISIDFRDADLREKDLTGINLRHASLEGADLSRAILDSANLSFSHLKGANLSHAHMNSTDLSHGDLRMCRLALAHLENAVFFFANLRGADLRGADLKCASMEDADLTNANLTHANLVRACLVNASLQEARLSDANLEGIDLSAANLEGVNVSSITYDQKRPLHYFVEEHFNPSRVWNRRFDIMLGTTIRCKGLRESCYGSRRFKKFLHDLDYLEEIMQNKWGKFLIFIWWLLSDCGKSISRWASWSGIIVILFAIIYHILGQQHFHIAFLNFSLFTTIYYSVVTFTTLGFGDFVPKTHVAAIFVMIEVVMGYIMLGGLISIFSNKLARRGD
ncbi:MAG: pentapeptide repeat-containing protein [Syntrophorhabdaceae bacterium]